MMKKLTLEEGLDILKKGIAKAMMILDGYPTSALFTCEEYMKLYDCVYDMCVQRPPYDYGAELYELFKKALAESITSRVMPALKDKRNVYLLNEVCNMWARYKVMAKCLGGIFLYLDRHFVEKKKTDSFSDLSICCFHDMVFTELFPKILEAAISLINQDRDENSGCRDLLNNVSTLFVEIGNGKMHYYENFETAVLTTTANYYNQLVSHWLPHYSPVEYFTKAQHYCNQEKERASQFLNQNSVEKLLQVVNELLLGQNAIKAVDSYQKLKAECSDGSIPYQDVLLGCAGLNLGEGSSRR
ncbi:cullin-1-like isoform X2 [Rutidosis leptorrhynchoides]|uniref:cullin-1-like isoform X2 n=1 Tax=Rutidosis leptorrhynchoides TaxID=125765 RepID=UPI003A9987D6